MTEAEIAAAEAEKARNVETQAKLDAQLEASAAKATDLKAVPKGHVRVLVTVGGVVHTGGKPKRMERDSGAEVYGHGSLAPTFDKGEEIVLPDGIAKQLEARHLVMIRS